jgi:IS4 transposase
LEPFGILFIITTILYLRVRPFLFRTTIHRAVLCVYSSVLVLVIVCLDYLSVYFPVFTHFTLHSRCKVFLKGLDFPVSITKQVFRNKNQSTGILYLACSNLDLTATDINTIYQKRWKVEEFHKSLKSNLALAKSPTGIAHTQKNHIFACFFAFVKLERLRINTKLNHFALKAKLYFNAVRASFSLLQKLSVPST